MIKNYLYDEKLLNDSLNFCTQIEVIIKLSVF